MRPRTSVLMVLGSLGFLYPLFRQPILTWGRLERGQIASSRG